MEHLHPEGGLTQTAFRDRVVRAVSTSKAKLYLSLSEQSPSMWY